MIKVVINADDLGLNNIVNIEIENFIKQGFITSTTMMANGEAVDDAIRIAKEYEENASFGVHLCLDEFKSITKSKILKEYGIVDANHTFTRLGVYKIRKPNAELKKAVFDELDAQIKVFHEAGIKISHFDGHHHCHTRKLWILDIIIELAKKYNINKIRRPSSNRFLTWKESYKSQLRNFTNKNKSFAEKSVIFFKTFVWISARASFNIVWLQKAKKQFTMPDKFFSYSTLSNNVTSLHYNINNKRVELMCHPGHPDYKIESEMIKQRVLNNKISYESISYKDI